MQTLDRSPVRSPAVLTTTRRDFTEVFVTAFGHDGPRATWDAVAAVLREHDCEPIAEKVYGASIARSDILAARAEALRRHGLAADLPCTFLDGAPCAGGDFAGVQIWGVRGDEVHEVRTVPGGRLWQGPAFRALHLAHVHGHAREPVSLQAQQMFAAAATMAAAQGFDYAQTVRTWIYSARLLDWYGELNRVRTHCYRQYDFTLPASTGIQGSDGEHDCMMDALLLDGVPSRVIDQTARQGPASAYGSSFSRAVELAHDGGSTVHVSGTASIDPQGRSVHLHDPSAQFLEMLLDVAAVLQEAGMGLADIKQATLFCKDDATWQACMQARQLLQLPAFPMLCVRADVCRHELLVEMEAVASR